MNKLNAVMSIEKLSASNALGKLILMSQNVEPPPESMFNSETAKERRSVQKSKSFIELCHSWDHKEFQRHYRMERGTFHTLLKKVDALLPQPYSGHGEKVIDSETRLLIVVWYLASAEPYRAISVRFGTTDSIVHESVTVVCQAICNALANNIKFPITEEECKKKAKEFYQLNGFPGIVGAIDGSHIRIAKPTKEPDAWVNRKSVHSINLTAISDAHGRFIFTSTGLPGSYHDARVFRLSSLDEQLAKMPQEFHLLGDSAYGLSTTIMVPYMDNGKLTAAQKAFNYRLSANRIIIENAFGNLKNKFPRVHSLLNVKSQERAILIVQTCTHLMNFIINEESECHSASDHNASDSINFSHSTTCNGKSKRQHLTEYLASLS